MTSAAVYLRREHHIVSGVYAAASNDLSLSQFIASTVMYKHLAKYLSFDSNGKPIIKFDMKSSNGSVVPTMKVSR